MRSFIKRFGLLLLALSVWAVACRPGPSKLTLFVSGDSRGYLEPCGCRRDQAGGLPGRMTLISAVPQAGRMVVDVGNLTPGVRPYDLMKARYLLEGMQMIGYDAVNLGAKEAELDIETLTGLVKDSNLPFVSANVVSKRTKTPLTEQFRIVQKAGCRIGVIGVTNCEPQSQGPGLEVLPVIETLAVLVPKVKPSCDYLIVLAYVDDDTCKNIADKFHEVDCVLGGDVPQSSNEVQAVNRASVFSVTDRGKVLGRIDLVSKGKTFSVSRSQALKVAADRVSSDKAIAGLIDRFKTELREKRYELASAEGMEPIQSQVSTADEFVGEAACVSCHSNAHKVWDKSGHSAAFETLKRVKSDYDPECLKCHTVGYALSSGFIDHVRTPKLEGVQCESCHGRGKVHTETQSKTALKPVTPSTCLSCHDKENSENFRYPVFWPKIAH